MTELAGVADRHRPDGTGPNVSLLRVSAKADYAVRSLAKLAAQGSRGLVKSEEIARAERIPVRFLLNILTELRNADIIRSRRGSDGGYQLARSPAEITVADIVHAVDGVAERDGAVTSARHPVWARADATVNSLLQKLTLADLLEVPAP